MPLSNIYFAYKNYINVDYGASWDLIKQLIKKHDVDERLDRITKVSVTEDIEKSDILVKKGYYSLSINNSKVLLVDQITGFDLYHTIKTLEGKRWVGFRLMNGLALLLLRN